MRYVLRWMRHGGAGIEQQVALTFAVGYLSYYTANAPANVSGLQPAMQKLAQLCFCIICNVLAVPP